MEVRVDAADDSVWAAVNWKLTSRSKVNEYGATEAAL
jgi:hypothetical protein